jgi:hypothetical protein
MIQYNIYIDKSVSTSVCWSYFLCSELDWPIWAKTISNCSRANDFGASSASCCLGWWLEKFRSGSNEYHRSLFPTICTKRNLVKYTGSSGSLHLEGHMIRFFVGSQGLHWLYQLYRYPSDRCVHEASGQMKHDARKWRFNSQEFKQFKLFWNPNGTFMTGI